MNKKPAIQLNIFFTGDKEDFDFRYYVQMTASKYLLNGTFQHLPKDWVHIKIEGSQEEVLAFSNSLMNGIMRRHIDNVHRFEKDPEYFNDFATLSKGVTLPDIVKDMNPSWLDKIKAMFSGSRKPSTG